MRIAMWSGPRNLSTAMMYSFGNRADCFAIDEPFYAAFLAESGIDHPMLADCLATQPQDPAEVVRQLRAQEGAVIYEKHMTHHMLDDFSLDWMSEVTNVFLIRHPARVINSYLAKRENPTFEDLGFAQQRQLFDRVLALGQTPVVVDADAILSDPKAQLSALCYKIGIPFDPAMLQWPAGPKPFDGAWAPHWYGSVHGSTGFGKAPGPLPDLPDSAQDLLKLALPYYDFFKAHLNDPAA